MNKFHYETCCVNSDCTSIENMVDQSKEITLKTFLKYVSREELYEILGGIYNKGFPIEKDYHVHYFKSEYQNKKCYYVVHSGIEYIFTK